MTTDLTIIILVTVLFIGAVVFGCATGDYYLGAANCERGWAQSGREWKFEGSIWTNTCYVRDDKGWIPASSVRVL